MQLEIIVHVPDLLHHHYPASTGVGGTASVRPSTKDHLVRQENREYAKHLTDAPRVFVYAKLGSEHLNDRPILG